MDANLIELAKGLMSCYEEAYNMCYPKVEKIINYEIRDINLIEHTLDQALDIYTEKGFYLSLKLLLYYQKIDIEKANNYLEILKKYREEEYNDLIKKYQKTK